ncbi:hypothetical protein N7539_004150 [Penicillium diatomitis]|uniref:Nuclear localization protein n=1 Tax=Penicillium diatomitis TaxID=2819901 RepID=A0A9W9XDA3_9EURO|nr:uncharacterized protein N7539_004150 [Penicillium diatomitis]KAJ5489260.1 hypothetical protein N7539_004150 [Penicillium diatomitis]
MNAQGEVVDGLGTIDPASLSNSVSTMPAPPTLEPSPRGVKRSRTPDHSGNGLAIGDQDDEDQSRRKRGRPPKTSRAGSNDHQAATTPIQTPQMQSRPLPAQTAGSPLASPPDRPTPTPTKSLVKALPSVRDHTSDQLNDAGDEYIPKEFDDAGETKVDADGHPLGGREYKCRTFRVPRRGNKLFMLATECARVLNYRDSYLLFNKNRSLHKIIASQIEKDDLIQQDILPYSYRSRQIAIVSARSMFRQFGSRVIVNGRRVRDDYWESKARKQGFTEEDMAGEKRPGTAKVRETPSESQASNLLPLPHNDVIFSNTIQPLPPGLSLDLSDNTSLSQHPLIQMTTTEDPRLRDYNAMPRSRQELTGQPYQDNTRTSTGAEIMHQAQTAADFNKALHAQRNFRLKGLDEFYAKPHEIPDLEGQTTIALDSGLSVSQPVQPVPMPPAGVAASSHPQHMIPPQPMVSTQQAFTQQQHQQPVGQSPVRTMPTGMQPNIMHQRQAPPMPAGMPQTSFSAYPPQQQPQQMWGQPPPQPQPSPMPSSGPQGQGVNMSQYGQQMTAPSQQVPSPMHHSQPPQQSPRQHRPSAPQMPQQFQQMPQHPQMQQQMQQQMQYAAAGPPAGYPGMARTMYPPPQAPGGQPIMAGNPQQAGMAMAMGPGGMPGWPAGAGSPMQPGQPQPGQSGSPLGGWSGY